MGTPRIPFAMPETTGDDELDKMLFELGKDLGEMSSKLDEVDLIVVQLFSAAIVSPMHVYTCVLTGHLVNVLRLCGSREQANTLIQHAFDLAFTVENPTNPGGN